MTREELRLECLSMAKAYAATPDGVIKVANKMAKFVLLGETPPNLPEPELIKSTKLIKR